MKQFRCADIVPGCAAAVRARRTHDVVEIAVGHLESVHGLRADDGLRDRVRSASAPAGLLASLLARA